jgi:hypothetical protein
VVNLGEGAGFALSMRQLLPGDAIMWKAWQVIKPMVRRDEDRIARAKKAFITGLTAHQLRSLTNTAMAAAYQVAAGTSAYRSRHTQNNR